VAYEKKGWTQKAIESYHTFIEKTPRDAAGYIRLATLFEKEGKRDQAINMYRKSLSLKPDYPALHLRLANVYLQNKGDGKNALHHFKKTIELDPNHPQAKSIMNTIKGLEKNYN
jgi:tetratricopeptide (TPR) repeat protein